MLTHQSSTYCGCFMKANPLWRLSLQWSPIDTKVFIFFYQFEIRLVFFCVLWHQDFLNGQTMKALSDLLRHNAWTFYRTLDIIKETKRNIKQFDVDRADCLASWYFLIFLKKMQCLFLEPPMLMDPSHHTKECIFGHWTIRGSNQF